MLTLPGLGGCPWKGFSSEASVETKARGWLISGYL